MAGDVVRRTNLNQLARTTVGNIYYETQPLTLRDGCGPSVGWTQMRCKIDEPHRFDWVRAMVGRVLAVRSVTSSSTPVLSRLIPETLKFDEPLNPERPDRPRRLQYCVGMETVQSLGLNANGTLGTFGGWPKTAGNCYDVRFERFPYNVWDDTKTYAFAAYATANSTGSPTVAPELFRYVVRNKRMTPREQPLPLGGPGSGFKVVDDSVEANRLTIGVGKRTVLYEDVVYTWVRIPRGWPPPVAWPPPATGPVWPPASDLNPKASEPASVYYTRDEYVGLVNHDWFDHLDVRGYAFPPEELRYDGYQTEEYVDAAGDEVMDCSFYFKRKKGGWNRSLKADGTYVSVSSTGLSTGAKPYETANMNNLFQWTAAL